MGMRDRVTTLGRRLEIASPAGGGTLVAATLPASAGQRGTQGRTKRIALDPECVSTGASPAPTIASSWRPASQHPTTGDSDG